MKVLAVILLCGVSVLGVGWFFLEVTRPVQPVQAKVTQAPTEAQIKALEARMDHLEAWAVRHGGKFK